VHYYQKRGLEVAGCLTEIDPRKKKGKEEGREKIEEKLLN
jgi:hypothetical protein